jgi:hypothetical protein
MVVFNGVDLELLGTCVIFAVSVHLIGKCIARCISNDNRPAIGVAILKSVTPELIPEALIDQEPSHINIYMPMAQERINIDTIII